MPSPRKNPRKNRKRPNPAYKKRPKSSFWDSVFGHVFDWTNQPNGRQVLPPLPTPHFDNGLLKEMLREGYRTLAKRYHPDLETGDAEKMTELNRIKTELGF